MDPCGDGCKRGGKEAGRRRCEWMAAAEAARRRLRRAGHGLLVILALTQLPSDKRANGRR
ncbi:hypothetical protein DRW48_02170 [Paracoccus suum]|uniref:Uncharacterized protein n=1 Tax=Paracoccus suum TaxID=2259340 RepID=A0A344PGZ9_9RHOB|nr:hypothetical protein DRW48_02170 [Paracoccus suum]